MNYISKHYIDFNANLGPELWTNELENSSRTNEWRQHFSHALQ